MKGESIDFKNIHLGRLIYKHFVESGMEKSRACNFLKCTEEEIEELITKETLDSGIILRWSKLMKYDFFRIYSHHLILYAPQSSIEYNIKESEKNSLPRFRKSLYTKEIIFFILERINNKEKTTTQIIEEYKIPKTTLYKWLNKYKNEINEKE